MGVVLPEYLANDASGLLEAGVRPNTHVVHGVQDTPVDRLEAVARIGKRPGHDHAHGVVQVGGAHLGVDVYVLDCAYVHGNP